MHVTEQDYKSSGPLELCLRNKFLLDLTHHDRGSLKQRKLVYRRLNQWQSNYFVCQLF